MRAPPGILQHAGRWTTPPGTSLQNLYDGSSTNDNGAHGYLVVVKGDLGDEGLNSVLGRWLKAELALGDRHVEGVEVKGLAPVFGWGREKYQLLTYRSGQLAKLPREALTWADELMVTAGMTVRELWRLRVTEATGNPPPRTSSPVKSPGRVDLDIPVKATKPATTEVNGSRNARSTGRSATGNRSRKALLNSSSEAMKESV